MNESYEVDCQRAVFVEPRERSAEQNSDERFSNEKSGQKGLNGGRTTRPEDFMYQWNISKIITASDSETNEYNSLLINAFFICQTCFLSLIPNSSNPDALGWQPAWPTVPKPLWDRLLSLLKETNIISKLEMISSSRALLSTLYSSLQSASPRFLFFQRDKSYN